MVPSSFVPAAVPNAVSNVPSKVPGLPASSVSVIDSDSPVTSLTTVTTTVPFPTRSASVTAMLRTLPGSLVGLIVTVPSDPPPTISVAVGDAVPPAAVKASL